MLVKEVMDCEPIAFDLDTPLEFAVQAMIKGASSCIIVTQNEAPCGIITERDITQVFASMVSHPESTTQQALPKYSVRDVMTTNPVCIQSELTVSFFLRPVSFLGGFRIVGGMLQVTVLTPAFYRCIIEAPMVLHAALELPLSTQPV